MTLSLLGCGLELGESPAPAGVVNMEGYSCVNQISLKVGEYFDGKLNDGQIVEFVDCLKLSVSEFAKRMKRRPGEEFYNPKDLREFINNRISKDRQLSEELLLEFMKIKQTFVGGRVDQISRGDLASALNLLEEIKRAALILRPHVNVFNASLGSEIPTENIAVELDLAADALNDVARIFVAALKTTANEYSLMDLERFLDEFRKFINWSETFPNGRPGKDWVELIASVKEISTGGDRYVIQNNEWESFLSLSKSTYIAYLKVKYGISGQNLWRDVGLKNLVHVMDQVRDELSRVISSRKGRLIPKEEILRLLQAVEVMDWLPFGLSSSIWAEALELLATKVLDGGEEGEFAGYRISHILKAFGEFEAWASTQKYIANHVVDQAAGLSRAPRVFVADGLEDLKKSQVQVPLGWIEFKKFIGSRRPLFMPESSYVALAYQSDLKALNVSYDLHNLSLTHLFYRIVKFVYQAYGIRTSSGDYYLSGPRLQEFYTDFFNLGVALEWLDKRHKTAGSRSYIEGNLFTYSANGMGGGDYALSLSEGIDLIAYLLTGGKLADDLYRELFSCPRGPVDFRGSKKLSRACVNNHLAQALINRLHFAPRLKRWISDLSPDEQRKYASLLVNAAFSKKNSQENWIEKSELSTISVIILYSESILTRFDADKSGELNNEEVSVAFPIFKDFINSLARALSGSEEDYADSEIRAIYEFILHFRRAPDTSSNWDMTRIWWNSWGEAPYWDIESDRMALTEAFSVIINNLLNVNQSPQK